jgi:hypothetical protein
MGYEALVFRRVVRPRARNQSGGKSKRRRRIAASIAAFVIMGVLASSAFAAPAADEYTLRLPDAAGEGNLGPRAPRAQTTDLPAGVRKQLQKSPEAPTLGSIATADELKAPPLPPPVLNGDSALDEDSTGGSSLPEAALSALGDPIGIAILLALAAIAGTAYLMRRQVGDGTGQPS